MADKKKRIVLDDLSGGRNGADPPLGPTFAANQVVDAVNGDWYRTAGFRKRYGSSNVSMTGSLSTSVCVWLGRHVPGTLDADAELWMASDQVGSMFQRLDNSTTWTTPTTVVDQPTPTVSPLWMITSASLDGKFFISYQGAGSDRLKVYDPIGNYIRYTGLIAPAAPSAANTVGGGAYAATLRYYRIRWIEVASAVIVRRSEPGPSVSFTPSGANISVTVTRPTQAGEGETHWELEVSLDNVTFYGLYTTGGVGSVIPIATTTAIDATATTVYSSLPLSDLTGTYTLQKSYRLIAADQNRLIGWGSWVATDKQNRLEISAIVGSRDRGDAERVDTTINYYIDFDENSSGPPTALIGPVWDKFYAFKSRQMFELSPTGSVDQPYRRTAITKTLGCVGCQAACVGEDSNGNPCIYVMTHRGVYRYGVGGLRYISRGIEDLILGPTSVMNMAATKVISHMLYHPTLRQVWAWFATGTSNDPDTLCVFDVYANQGQGAWSRFTGSITTARCSVMFADSIGATMGFSLVPYIGQSSANNRVIKAADTAVTQDAGTNFQATITTKPIDVPGYNMATGDLMVLAPAASGVTLTATVTPDFGANPVQTGTALLTAAGSETRVTARFGGSGLSGSNSVAITIGDAAAVSNAWSFDRIIVPAQAQEPLS